MIVGRLARTVLSFQDNFLSRESSPSGLLCQVQRQRQRHTRQNAAPLPETSAVRVCAAAAYGGRCFAALLAGLAAGGGGWQQGGAEDQGALRRASRSAMLWLDLAMPWPAGL